MSRTTKELLKDAEEFKKLHKKATSFIRGKSRVFISAEEEDARFDAGRVLESRGIETAALIAELSAKVREAEWQKVDENTPKAKPIMIAVPFDDENGGYHCHVAAFWKNNWYVAGQAMKTPPACWKLLILPTPPKKEDIK